MNIFRSLVFNRWSFRLRVPQYIRIPFLISYIFSFLILLIVLSTIFRIQPVIPLLYTLTESSSQLVTREWLFIFPIISFSISLFHTSLLTNRIFRNETLARLFAWTTIIIQLSLFLSLARILWIVL